MRTTSINIPNKCAKANEQHGFKYIPLDKLARELKKMDLVIPFGDRGSGKDIADA